MASTTAPSQDCSRCRLLETCWSPKLRPEAVAVNLLVCRIERGLRRDAAAKALLQRLMPKLRKAAQALKRDLPHEDLETLQLELQSVVLEALMTTYRMGEWLHPLRWLFGGQHGAVPRWAARRIRASRLEARRHTSFEPETETAAVAMLPVTPEAVLDVEPEIALRVLEDGRTLTALEYRVLRFCLAHARPGRAPMKGLQAHLAACFGVRRSNVNQIYQVALRKVVDKAFGADRYFETRGMQRLEDTKRRLAGLGPPTLTQAEINDLLTLRETTSVVDLAWFFGITPDGVYRVLRRHDETQSRARSSHQSISAN